MKVTVMRETEVTFDAEGIPESEIAGFAECAAYTVDVGDLYGTLYLFKSVGGEEDGKTYWTDENVRLKEEDEPVYQASFTAELYQARVWMVLE